MFLIEIKNNSWSGRSKSSEKSLRKCYKCGEIENYKKNCRFKSVERWKGSDGVPSIEGKTSSKEGWNVYLASSSTQVDHDLWMVDLGASFHMTLHREWFCKYEKYNGGDIFLGGNLIARIT
jgi:hypothetical protein